MNNSPIPFVKMNGIGNDFAILDSRTHVLPHLKPAAIQAMSNRKTGIGFDQLIIIEQSDRADCFMRIVNKDGSEAEACGNAMRCVTALLHRQANIIAPHSYHIETRYGVLECVYFNDQKITINMGAPKTHWRSIPLAEPLSTATGALSLDHPLFSRATVVNIGNPHIVFFVRDCESVDLKTYGPFFENHVLFPNKTNVEFAHIMGPHKIRMRVWERGSGITKACGSAACATHIAARLRGLIEGEKSQIIMDGGALDLSWGGLKTNHDYHDVYLSGPVSFDYEAYWDMAQSRLIYSDKGLVA